MTLKEFLTTNGITISNEDRCKLGLRIAQIWDSKRLGDKDKVLEGTYKVTDYPIEYLESKIIINTIMKFLKV
jgi:hypothetical protein